MCKERVGKALEAAVAQQIFPGCVVGICDSTIGIEYAARGRYTYEENAPAVSPDAIYDVASITKSIPTALLALMALDRGNIGVQDKLIEYLPEFRGTHREQIGLWHLLTHTLDFRFSLSAYKDRSPEQLRNILYSAEAVNPPGMTFRYCNATSILLGMVVERVWRASLDKCAQTTLFEPLGMTRTWFTVPPEYTRQVVPTEIDPWRGGLVQAKVHDESAYAMRPEIIAGSAGLFSTARDICNVLHMLVNEGAFRGMRLYSPYTVVSMHTNQFENCSISQGLGWELNQKRYMGERTSECAFGKTGFTGCVCIVDPCKSRAMVMLSNYVHPRRRGEADTINTVRKNIADIVFGS